MHLTSATMPDRSTCGPFRPRTSTYSLMNPDKLETWRLGKGYTGFPCALQRENAAGVK
jgi:hypothetical protein